MRPRRLLGILMAISSGLGVRDALAQEAPFGLTWGPMLEVPRPSLAIREGNITALIYLPDRVPAGIADTEEIVLEVCTSEGLQRAIWVSRPLPLAEAEAKYAAALAEGTRRHGLPEIDHASGEVVWREGRTSLAWGRADANLRQLTMAVHGPGFSACSGHHREITGHPATEHRFEAHAEP